MFGEYVENTKTVNVAKRAYKGYSVGPRIKKSLAANLVAFFGE